MSNDCGCCTVVSSDTRTENRPWLSAVAYRIGTFATFRKAIVDELSHTPELAGLSARVSDDYTIMAIEPCDHRRCASFWTKTALSTVPAI